MLSRGRVEALRAAGDFQLIVEHMEEAGLGALKREFERLKKKLAGGRLVREEREKRHCLPSLDRIGVITSPSGAAIRDILQHPARGASAGDVLIYPTRCRARRRPGRFLGALQPPASARNATC